MREDGLAIAIGRVRAMFVLARNDEGNGRLARRPLHRTRGSALRRVCGGPRSTRMASTPKAPTVSPGQGVYLWARGDEVRFERAPLCPSCASAIGMTALTRWEIEEEEG